MLVHCEECRHEISSLAAACPRCGLPIDGRARYYIEAWSLVIMLVGSCWALLGVATLAFGFWVVPQATRPFAEAPMWRGVLALLVNTALFVIPGLALFALGLLLARR